MEGGVSESALSALSRLGIEYDMIEHPPVMTIADCAHAQRALGAIVPKNLFLTPRNMSAFYLCLMSPDGDFKTADISKKIGSPRLSFAPEDQLMRLMRTAPGAVSPLGLLFDGGCEVRLIADKRLRGEGRLAFHPCVNTATVAISMDDLIGKFLPFTGHSLAWVDAHAEQ
jgi:Ala-tRNA(Pro) deacylase